MQHTTNMKNPYYKAILSGILALTLVLGCSSAGKNGGDTTVLFTPDWESLKQYECPDWFRDVKFGIWSHWGPQSVPEYGDWYFRRMYLPGNKQWNEHLELSAYEYHCQNYGHPTEFGYKDLIPLFTASKFDADSLMELYYRAGARYFVSMGQHHDNFDLWNSQHQPWNSVNMGPKRDIVKEWQEAARKRGMKFGVTFHGEYTWQLFEASRNADPDGPLKGVMYDGRLTREDGKGKWWEGYDPQDLYVSDHKPTTPFYLEIPDSVKQEKGDPWNQAFVDKFNNRVKDIIDNYQADLLYFDSGLPLGEENARELVSYYYNKAATDYPEKDGVVFTCKVIPEELRRALTLDYENSQSQEISPYPFQTDFSLDGWFYNQGTVPVPTKEVVQKLVDIVSKNGTLLLNITQREDGTIREYAYTFLKEMAGWMDINNESVYGTRPWKIFGEGATNVSYKHMTHDAPAYTSRDIRFVTKGDILYATLMEWPEDGRVTIASLPENGELHPEPVRNIALLGSETPLKWKQTARGVEIELPEKKPCEYAYVFKIM